MVTAKVDTPTREWQLWVGTEFVVGGAEGLLKDTAARFSQHPDIRLIDPQGIKWAFRKEAWRMESYR